MRAAAGAEGGAQGGAGPGAGGEEVWSELFACPVCMELLDKPSVAECGHVTCFWCAHLSLNAMEGNSREGTSPCALCRAPRRALPRPCYALVAHLSKSFPHEAERRRTDVAEEYERRDKSTEIEPAPEDERLECRACGRCLFGATVLTACGHAVCAGCLPKAGTTCMCPACRVPTRGPFALCRLLDDLAARTRPDDYAARKVEQTAQPAAEAADTAPAVADDAQVEGGTAGGAQAECGAASAVDAAVGQGAAAAAGADQEGADEAFIHWNAGCDACGTCPIRGRRFRCKDCPDAMGFDLCGDCFDLGLHNVGGRFAQEHTPQHAMEQVPQVPCVWARLLAENQHLTPAALNTLIAMQYQAFRAHREDEEGSDGATITDSEVRSASDSDTDTL